MFCKKIRKELIMPCIHSLPLRQRRFCSANYRQQSFSSCVQSQKSRLSGCHLPSITPTTNVHGGSLMPTECCKWVAVQCAVTSIILTTGSWAHPVTKPNATDRGGSSSDCDTRHFPIRHSLMGGSAGRRYAQLTIQWPPDRFMCYRP